MPQGKSEVLLCREDSEEDLDQPNPFAELQGWISEVLLEEFKELNESKAINEHLDTHVSLIEDEDDMEVDPKPIDDDPEIVKFVFEDLGRIIRAHKCILTSKLPLFRSMLSGNMKESTTRQIEVFDTSFETYFAFIEFIYTGAIKKLDSNNLVELLELSDRFCVEDLRELISDALVSNLDPGTIKDILEVAHHYKLSTLKQECWRYAKTNKSQMSRYGVFKVLDPKDMEMIKKIDT